MQFARHDYGVLCELTYFTTVVKFTLAHFRHTNQFDHHFILL